MSPKRRPHRRLYATEPGTPIGGFAATSITRYNDSSLLKNYEYQSLEGRSIRLIQLERGSQEEPVHCSLKQYTLDNNVEFNALSYTWGSQAASRYISCDGQSLKITGNLYDALLQIRADGNVGLLWVDAICINQADITEKTEQVRLMRDIYSKASLVIIWLGRQNAGDAAAVGLLQRIHHVLDHPHLDDIVRRLEHHALGLPRQDSSEWKSLVLFLNKSWFNRVWVVQEFLLARRRIFLCGRLKIDSSILLKVVKGLNENIHLRWALQSQQPEGTYANAMYLSLLLDMMTSEKEFVLLPLLIGTRNFQATVPQDKIFALVGLTSDLEDSFINYEVGYRETLIKLATKILTNPPVGISPLLLLNYVEASALSDDLPSWVPKWKDTGRPLSVLPHVGGIDEVDPLLTISENNVLHLHGIILDRVLKKPLASPFSPSVVNPYNHSVVFAELPHILAWLATVRSSLKSLPEDTEEILWRTLICNVAYINQEWEPAPPFYGAAFAAWEEMLKNLVRYHECSRPTQLYVSTLLFSIYTIKSAFLLLALYSMLHAIFTPAPFPRFTSVVIWCLMWIIAPYTTRLVMYLIASAISGGRIMWDPNKENERNRELSEKSFGYEGAFREASVGRAFCVTENGRAGWVPAIADVGDDICFLRGSQLLSVLRKAGGGGYRFLGQAYVHGLMEGERWTSGTGVQESDINLL